MPIKIPETAAEHDQLALNLKPAFNKRLQTSDYLLNSLANVYLTSLRAIDINQKPQVKPLTLPDRPVIKSWADVEIFQHNFYQWLAHFEVVLTTAQFKQFKLQTLQLNPLNEYAVAYEQLLSPMHQHINANRYHTLHANVYQVCEFSQKHLNYHPVNRLASDIYNLAIKVRQILLKLITP